jgi:hypothetical protein
MLAKAEGHAQGIFRRNGGHPIGFLLEDQRLPFGFDQGIGGGIDRASDRLRIG